MLSTTVYVVSLNDKVRDYNMSNLNEMLKYNFMWAEEMCFKEFLSSLNGRQIAEVQEINLIPRLVDRIQYYLEYYQEKLMRSGQKATFVHESRYREKGFMLL